MTQYVENDNQQSAPNQIRANDTKSNIETLINQFIL